VALQAAGDDDRPGRHTNPDRPARPSSKQSDTVDLVRRPHTHADDLLPFLANLRVPFDTNQAARDIRMPKLKQKISGAFLRTKEGAATFCTIRSYLATLRKQSRDLFEPLVLTFKHEPPEGAKTSHSGP
jgi:transposase